MQRSVIGGRYALIEVLGGGGVAEVYLAHDEVLDRDVALKILKDRYTPDEEFVGRFRSETQSLENIESACNSILPGGGQARVRAG